MGNHDYLIFALLIDYLFHPLLYTNISQYSYQFWYSHNSCSSALLCSGSEVGTIKVWDLMSGELLHSLTTAEGQLRGGAQVRSIAAGPDGKMLTSQDNG